MAGLQMLDCKPPGFFRHASSQIGIKLASYREPDPYSINDYSINDYSINDYSINDYSINDYSINDYSINDYSINDYSINGRHSIHSEHHSLGR
jgi:hypothetical protein